MWVCKRCAEKNEDSLNTCSKCEAKRPQQNIALDASCQDIIKAGYSAEPTSISAPKGPANLCWITLILIAIGAAITIYYTFFFDVSVPVNGMETRVNNIGLLSDRQNGIIFGFGMMILGAFAEIINRMRGRES